jgi:hypothetical protein
MSTIKSSGENLKLSSDNTKDIELQHNGSTKLTVKSDGNVGIGITSPVSKLHVGGADGYSYIKFTSDATGHTSSDGARIGLNSTDFRIINAESSGSMLFLTANTEKLRIQSGGGISFNGDTAAANALDDYEEGTWTPRMTTTGTDYTTSGRNGATGVYVKVGNVVTCVVTCYITTPSGGSGLATITGFPFQTNGVASCVPRFGRTTLTHTMGNIGYIYDNASDMKFNGNNNAANATELPHTIWHNVTPYIDCTITYIVD